MSRFNGSTPQPERGVRWSYFYPGTSPMEFHMSEERARRVCAGDFSATLVRSVNGGPWEEVQSEVSS